MAPLPFGSSWWWGVTRPQGDLLCTLEEEGGVGKQWRESFAVFVVVCYWSGGGERGAQFGEVKGPMVSPFQAFAFC